MDQATKIRSGLLRCDESNSHCADCPYLRYGLIDDRCKAALRADLVSLIDRMEKMQQNIDQGKSMLREAENRKA